ncbi:MAG: MerR family transcriptional regulator [Christensenellaceae bacterium]|nr:MerR family transcriptional regulator [Christensenellaceae bacterium]
MTTKEFADACNVEKRTLFYYDEIGLLKPARVRGNGYREYDIEQFTRMETIKLLQSSGLSLMEIKSVLLCEGEGRNIEVVLECKRRVEEHINNLKDGLAYMNQRIELRECYMRHPGESVFIEHFEERPLAAIRPEYHSHMRISYLDMGHYLSIAEDVNTLRPKFFFKFTDDPHADTVLPAGKYICTFIEQTRGNGIYIPPLIEKFAFDLRRDGYSIDDTVYVEELPPWIIDKRDVFIIRFAVRLADDI